MSGIINTGSHPRLLVPGISLLFGEFYKQLKEIHPEVYMKKKSKRHFEEAVQLIGVGQAQKKGEGDAITVDATKQGWSRRTVHENWQKSIMITQEAFNDNLYQSQSSVLSKELAKALFHAKEFNAAALFNNATSTSAPYVGGDGKALLATDHPTGSGGTFSNLVSSDLSELALENAIIQLGGWVGSDDLLINATAKGLLIPRQLGFTAHRILNSTLRAGTADNDANALRDRKDIPKVIEWRFLTDVDSWYILTDIDSLYYYERTARKPRHFQEDTTENQVYSMSERYSFDYCDARCVIGSLGV